MINLNKSLFITLCFCSVFFQKTAFAANSKNKFYLEPFFKIDYQIWQNDQFEETEDGTFSYKFRGLHYGPRVGAKFLWIYNNWWKYGFEGSYAYLFNTYNPDPGTSKEAEADDSFITDSNSTQIQLGLFTGFQYRRFGLKFHYFPMTTIENNALHSTVDAPGLKNTYEGSGMGIGISYIYRPKVNFYIEYQSFTLNKLTIESTEYQLPSSSGSMTFKELKTTKYSVGISMIF